MASERNYGLGEWLSVQIKNEQFRSFCLRIIGILESDLDGSCLKDLRQTFSDLKLLHPERVRTDDYWRYLSAAIISFYAEDYHGALENLESLEGKKLSVTERKPYHFCLSLYCEIKWIIGKKETEISFSKDALDYAKDALASKQTNRNLFLAGKHYLLAALKSCGRDVYDLPWFPQHDIWFQGEGEDFAYLAIDCLNKLVRKVDNSYLVYTMRGTLHFMMEDYVAAKANLEKAIQLGDYRETTVKVYWFTFFKQRDFVQSLEVIKNALEHYPTSKADWLEKKGFTLFEAHRFSEAVEVYENVLEVNEAFFERTPNNGYIFRHRSPDDFIYRSLIKYYLAAILYSHDPSIIMGDKNKYYAELDKLLEDGGDSVSEGQFKHETAGSSIKKMRDPRDADGLFHFGKHEGEAIADVATTDPRYVFWCISNIASFVVSNSLFITLRELKAREDYLIALEINCAKLLIVQVYGAGDNLGQAYRNYRMDD